MRRSKQKQNVFLSPGFFVKTMLSLGALVVSSQAWAGVRELVHCASFLEDVSDVPWGDEKTEIRLDLSAFPEEREVVILPNDRQWYDGIYLYRGDSVYFYRVSENQKGYLKLLPRDSKDKPFYLKVQKDSKKVQYTLQDKDPSDTLRPGQERPIPTKGFDSLDGKRVRLLGSAVVGKLRGIPARMKAGLEAYDPSGNTPSAELRKRRLDPKKVVEILKACKGQDATLNSEVDWTAREIAAISPEFQRLWMQAEGGTTQPAAATTQPTTQVAPR